MNRVDWKPFDCLLVRIQPQQLPGINNVVLWDASELRDVVNGALEVHFLVIRTLGLGREGREILFFEV